MMSQGRALGRYAISAFVVVALFLYVVYFTSELFTRLDNIRKLERLQQYGRELDDITKLVQQYKAESQSVSKGISILRDIVSKMSDAKLHQELYEQNRKLHMQSNLQQIEGKDTTKISKKYFEPQLDITSQQLHDQQFIFNRKQFHQLHSSAQKLSRNDYTSRSAVTLETINKLPLQKISSASKRMRRTTINRGVPSIRIAKKSSSLKAESNAR